MNAVEIEQAVSDLADAPFDAAGFPFAFLLAFGNKETTLRKLRNGGTNKSDLGGVLQTNNIHIAIAPGDGVTSTLVRLRASPATSKAKAKFILATAGDTLEAEDLVSGETIACDYADFPNHFGFFLPLAGISTVKQIREKLLRYPGNESPEPALPEAARGQSGMGQSREQGSHEPLHGPFDILFLRRGNRHLRRHRAVHEELSSA